MKSSHKKKGGKRKGAGRKPSGVTKEAVTVYTDISRFGGKEGARMAIYEFLDGKINFTGKSSFIPLDIPPSIQKKLPPSDLESKQKAPKEEKKFIQTYLKPQENPMAFTNEVIQKEIEAIKAEKCPEHRSKTSIGRKSWELDQKRRIEELEGKLK